MLTCSFCRFTQAALELATGEKWHSIRRGVQDVAEFISD
jgi:hypothetical protein